MDTVFTRTASAEMYATFEGLALNKQGSFEELTLLLRQAVRPLHSVDRFSVISHDNRATTASSRAPRLTVDIPHQSTPLPAAARDDSDDSTADDDHDEDTCSGIFQRTRSASRQRAEHLDADGRDASLSRHRRSSPQARSRFSPYASPRAQPVHPRHDVVARIVPSAPQWDTTLVERRLQQEAPRLRRGREGARSKVQSEI